MTTTVTEQKKPATIRQQLESDAFKNSIAKILPKHVTPERMARIAVTALTRTPMLAECDQGSFFRCMLDLSQWGLEPDGRRAHLIPFRNNQKGIVECQLIIDYKGLVELCYRSGVVANIHSDIVCENDDFVYDRGELVKHKIDFQRPRGKMYAAYCLVRMKDGTEKCEVLTKEEIDGIRARSKAGKSGPWVTDYNEMAKKTAFRRVSKWIPLSAEIRDAVMADDDTVEGEVVREPRQKLGLDDLTDRLIGSSEPEPVAQPATDFTAFRADLAAAKTPADVDQLLKLAIPAGLDLETEAAMREMAAERKGQLGA